MLIAVVVFAILLAVIRMAVRRAVARTNSAEQFAPLRLAALTATPTALGLIAAHDAVYGAAMEATSEAATLTVVAYNDGEARLFVSSGGAITGGAQYEQVRAAAKTFVDAVSRVSPRDGASSGQAGLPVPHLPAVGETRVYALTASGPQLVNAGDPVERLGDALIATLRAAEARRG